MNMDTSKKSRDILKVRLAEGIILIAVILLAYNLYQSEKTKIFNEGAVYGRDATITDLIRASANCQMVTVTIPNRNITLVDANCGEK